MRNSKHLVELKSRAEDRRYNVVSSCNGLLCLTEQLDDEPLEKDNVVVCNPVTGEFAYIPESCHNGKHFGVGFGFCPKKNENKVLRMFARLVEDAFGFHKLQGCEMGEIHTLGTDSWRIV